MLLLLLLLMLLLLRLLLLLLLQACDTWFLAICIPMHALGPSVLGLGSLREPCTCVVVSVCLDTGSVFCVEGCR